MFLLNHHECPLKETLLPWPLKRLTALKPQSITGVNMPATQLQIAMARKPRKPGTNGTGTSEVDITVK